MPVTIEQLSAAINAFFAQKIGDAGGDTPGTVVLVFDGLASSFSPDEFGVGGSDSQQQLLAHQRAAQLADRLPVASGLANGWYLPRTGARLSHWYKVALTASTPVSGTEQAIKAFELGKADALKRLELNEQIEIGGVTPGGPGVNPTGVIDKIYATGMSPPDWFVPDSDAWQSCRFDGTQPVSPAPTPIPVPVFDAQALVTMPDEPGFSPKSVSFRVQAGEAISEGDPLANITFSSDEIPDRTVHDVLLYPLRARFSKPQPAARTWRPAINSP